MANINQKVVIKEYKQHRRYTTRFKLKQIDITMEKSKYQNVSFSEICNYIKSNINNNKALKFIENKTQSDEQESNMDRMWLKGYKAFSIEPSGIISILAFIENPQEYMLLSKSEKTLKLCSLATDLQNKTDLLKGSHLNRKRKKVHDLIGNVFNGGIINDDNDIIDLFSSISYMMNINFIMVKSNIQENIETATNNTNTNNNINEISSHKGYIHFSSNPINWEKESPIWIIDYRSRWVAYENENSSLNIHAILSQWLQNCQDNGWTIMWPELNITKAAAIEELSKEITYSPSDNSLLKDVLCERLSKIKTIRLFSAWTTKFD